MRISSRLDYAISCIIRVAGKYKSKKPVSVSYISDKERLEYDYTEQLMVKMKRAGLLKSIRGPAGGYVLARYPEKITLKDVAMAIEGKILEPVCYRKKGRRKGCIHLSECKLRDIWFRLDNEIGLFLRRYDLKRLLLLRRKEKGWNGGKDGEGNAE